MFPGWKYQILRFLKLHIITKNDLLLPFFSGANSSIGWVDYGSVDCAMNNSITKEFSVFFNPGPRKSTILLPKISYLRPFWDQVTLGNTAYRYFIFTERFIVWILQTPHFDEKTLVSIVFFEIERNIPNRKWLKWLILS